MDFVLVNENDFMKARKEIRKNNGKKIIFLGLDDVLNRKVLEKEKIDLLLLSQSGKRDPIKQRNSGFNHVLAKIAKKKGVTIGINFDEIAESDRKRKADILGRVIQNVKLCNKNKLKMKFISPKNKNINNYDLKSLGLVLGMPTWMTKNL